VYDRAYVRSGGEPLAWEDAGARIAGARFERPTTRVIETQAELREVLGRNAALDLGRYRAVLVATGPRSSTGYALDVVRIEEQRGRVLVEVRERAPSLGDAVQPGVTYPFRLLLLPRDDKPVEVER
jgi:hypothetical protein